MGEYGSAPEFSMLVRMVAGHMQKTGLLSSFSAKHWRWCQVQLGIYFMTN